VEKSFVAGADIAEFAQFSVEEGAQLAHKDKKYYSTLSKT
jgi:enoyl-CoA hydratase/carnithine racemase